MEAGYTREDLNAMLENSYLDIRVRDVDTLVLTVDGLDLKTEYSLGHVVGRFIDGTETDEGTDALLDLARNFERMAKSLRRAVKDMAA